MTGNNRLCKFENVYGADKGKASGREQYMKHFMKPFTFLIRKEEMLSFCYDIV